MNSEIWLTRAAVGVESPTEFKREANESPRPENKGTSSCVIDEDVVEVGRKRSS